mmetsp:Transcript_33722/g.61652  ORF Transcript_33722/g.61652 Transcript_33722/m.61652 type:complete len:365 (+) Transcript_33722:63-1157(+)
MKGNRKFVGQQTSIAQEIKRNLRNYSDAQLLAELLQNADDAGATRVSFMLDERTHPSSTLGGLGAAVASLQGPALLCFDDAVFKEENFEGLFRFGIGSKKGDPTQTGRFGLGFNAVYHITECPMLVSADKLLVLDPQRKYLDGVIANPAVSPGVMVGFAEEAPGAMDDLLGAFTSGPGFAGCDLLARQAIHRATREAAPYPGTLFRFPLRTSAHALGSELRKEPTHPEAVLEMLRNFTIDGAETALFLQHVSTLEIWRWRPGDSGPARLWSLNLTLASSTSLPHLSLPDHTTPPPRRSLPADEASSSSSSSSDSFSSATFAWLGSPPFVEEIFFGCPRFTARSRVGVVVCSTQKEQQQQQEWHH